jgi:putative endopeptidase
MLTKKRRQVSHRKSQKCRCKPVMKYMNPLQSFEKDFDKKENPHENIGSYLITLFDKPFAPSQYTPRNDYYTYINYQWIAAKKRETERESKYYVQVDSFRMVQEKVYYELINLTKEYIKTNHTAKSAAIKNLYESMVYLDNSEAEGQIKYTAKKINDAMASHDNDKLYWILAQINQNEILAWGCPISWSVSKDSKHSSLYKSNISEPKLSLYDYMLYIEDDRDDAETKQNKHLYKLKFLHFVQEMFDACLGKGHDVKPSYIWEVECSILTMMGCDSVKNENKDYYNVVTKKDALDKYGFDWGKFAKEVGYKDIPSTFICNNLSYLKCIMETLKKEWRTPKWKAYFMYVVFRQIMRFHKKWRIIHWEFYGKFINGQSVPWPDEIYPVFGLSLCFNTFLTNEYIRNNNKTGQIEYVTTMANDMLMVFKRVIRRNNWLSPETKKYALMKLEHIKLVVGNPMLLREDPILSYNKRGAYQNMKKIAWWRTKKMISIDGTAFKGDIPIIDWEQFKLVGSQAYIVNAYYTPIENSIYVPLAYLQKPFIDLDNRGMEYNLAHIGYTIAHEMSHCLDDTGSKYDYDGNLHNWWTKEDRQKFEVKVKDVVKQYETFAAYDGIKMNATLSTGENLADISGLAICMEYLKDFNEQKDDIVPVSRLSFEKFFIYVAVQGRQHISEKAIKAQLKTNPHPLDKYRVNCPLSRLKLFRSIYKIKKGDKMYWHSTDTIW